MAKILILGAGAMGSAFSVPSLERQHEVIIAGTHLEDAFIDEMKNNNIFWNNDHIIINSLCLCNH